MAVNEGRQLIFILALVLVVTFISLAPSLIAGFVNVDDVRNLCANPDVQKLSLGNVKKIFTSFYVANYLPVTMISFAVDFALYRFLPFFHHFTNLKLHLFNCLLVFWLIYLVSKNIFVAGLTAIFFGSHPLRVESVAWISERKDLLYSFFFLGAIISYFYYNRRNTTGLYWFSLVLFLFSGLSKVVGIFLLPVFFLMDFLAGKKWAEAFRGKGPFFIFFCLFGFLGMVAQSSVRAGEVSYSPGFLNNLLFFGYSVWFFLQKIFFPVKLSCLYFPPEAPLHFTRLSSAGILFFLVSLFFLAVLFWLRNKKIGFGLLFFIILLVPVVGLNIIFDSAAIHDRYSYLPSVGIFYILSEFIFFLWKKATENFFKFFLEGVMAVFVAGMIFLTWDRCYVWKNSCTLWTDALKYAPQSGFCYFERGLANLELGYLKSALADFNRVISLLPDSSVAYVQRSEVFRRLKNYPEALKDCEKSIALDAKQISAYRLRTAIYRELKEQGLLLKKAQ